MNDAAYEKAFDRLIGHEGKYSKDSRDRGNWTTGTLWRGELKGTKYGISAMSYPKLDIKNLTLEQAKAIYYTDFWKRSGADHFFPSLGFQLFDAGVNHGIGNAIRFLQRAVGAADDGDVGPETIRLVAAQPKGVVLALFNCERLEFMTRITTFNEYGRGWSRRVSTNIRMAVEDYLQHNVSPTVPEKAPTKEDNSCTDYTG